MSIKLIDAETGELMPAPRNLSSDIFLDFERQDNESIIAELRGEVIEEYAYSFTQGDQTIVGLSLPGVMSVAQQMGGITCGKPEWTVTDDEIICDIAATDHKTGLTLWGTSTEPRIMHTRNGNKPDKFARQKALSKAQRNAVRKLIPETVAKKALEMALEKMGKLPSKRGGRLQPVERPHPAAPAIAAPPRVEHTGSGPLDPLGRDRARDFYRQMKELGNYGQDEMVAWMDCHDLGNDIAHLAKITEQQADAMMRDAIQRKRPWETPAEPTNEPVEAVFSESEMAEMDALDLEDTDGAA